LPNRSELLDTLLFGGEGRQPLITDVDTTGASTTTGCDEVAVLVTGPRLWRNTAVTIGGSKANEIEVLPNMEGIIAKFRRDLSQQPAAAGPASMDTTIEGKLRVWTSDGMDDWPPEVKLAPPSGC
jgi:hypothetical protein